jgi:cupin fold WbuC family metalloprotein
MNLDNKLFDTIQLLAEESPRRRMHYDLRTESYAPAGVGHENWKDMSQRMLNVLMTDTVVPIHRHTETSETVIVCRGKVREEFYDAEGNKTAEFVMEAGGDCPGVQVPMGQYHTLVCLEDGSVIFEAKDRAYDPVGTEEFLGR